MNGYLKALLAIIGVLAFNQLSKVIPLNGIFTISITIGIVLYIGYINTSIRDLRKRVNELEEKLNG